jgi:hypothetical protein
MQYQDGHISTCFNEKILVIYILCICLCQLVVIRYLFTCVCLFVINRSFILFIVRLFVLFSFSLDSLLIYCSKEKRKTLILNRVQVFRSCYLFKYLLPVQVPATCSSTCYLFKYPLYLFMYTTSSF